MECSAITGENVKKVFEEAVKTAMMRSPPPPVPCVNKGLSVKRAKK